MALYRRVFASALQLLADNRFLAIKVGESRDKCGAYRGFVPHNVVMFQELGLAYYNEAILVTAIGSRRSAKGCSGPFETLTGPSRIAFVSDYAFWFVIAAYTIRLLARIPRRIPHRIGLVDAD
jgi:hypothetical protein